MSRLHSHRLGVRNLRWNPAQHTVPNARPVMSVTLKLIQTTLALLVDKDLREQKAYSAITLSPLFYLTGDSLPGSDSEMKKISLHEV